jgi:hypothetical protein
VLNPCASARASTRSLRVNAATDDADANELLHAISSAAQRACVGVLPPSIAVSSMAGGSLSLPIPSALPSVAPGPSALGTTLGIAEHGATPAAGGCEPIFFSGPPYKGKKATKVFGYIGLPAGLEPGETCPGMVLLHGGGGTAFDVWVELWNARGYAAITFDQCGEIPMQPRFGDGAPHERHADGVVQNLFHRTRSSRAYCLPHASSIGIALRHDVFRCVSMQVALLAGMHPFNRWPRMILWRISGNTTQ